MAGGRSYEDIPVNANVVETRRASRFWNYGHTPGGAVLYHATPRGRWDFAPALDGASSGPIEPPPAEINPEYPHTLDLRRHNQ